MPAADGRSKTIRGPRAKLVFCRSAFGAFAAHGRRTTRFLNEDTHFFQGRINGQLAAEFPIVITTDALNRGRDRYNIFCTPCLIGRVVVMEPEDFERWLGGVTEASPVEAGERLFSDLNCVNCHASGALRRGPQLGGLFGTEVALQDGRKVKFDEAYIRESIINPAAKVVLGFQPVMPTYRGQVSEEQILDLIAYIRSLTPGTAAHAGGVLGWDLWR